MARWNRWCSLFFPHRQRYGLIKWFQSYLIEKTDECETLDSQLYSKKIKMLIHIKVIPKIEEKLHVPFAKVWLYYLICETNESQPREAAKYRLRCCLPWSVTPGLIMTQNTLFLTVFFRHSTTHKSIKNTSPINIKASSLFWYA